MPINYDAPIEIRDARNGSWFWVHTHVWRDKKLTKSDKIVYGTIASYASDTQNSFPSMKTIALDGDISERQVYYSIRVLEEKGYISIKRHKGGANLYTLLKTTPAMDAPPPATIAPTPAKSLSITITNKQDKLSTNVDNGETPIKGYGNPSVSRIISEFCTLTGLSRPSDRDPRRWAWLFTSNGVMGVEHFTPCLQYLQQLWSKVDITKIETVYRNYSLYERDVLKRTNKTMTAEERRRADLYEGRQ